VILTDFLIIGGVIVAGVTLQMQRMPAKDRRFAGRLLLVAAIALFLIWTVG
jgi:hypothetical protein